MPTASEEFCWPWQHDFPPFFTLQPNEETRRKQMDAWCQLVLSYFQSKKQLSVDVSTLMASQCELFSNPKINRKANSQLIQAIFDELHRRGNLEWQDRCVEHCSLSSSVILCMFDAAILSPSDIDMACYWPFYGSCLHHVSLQTSWMHLKCWKFCGTVSGLLAVTFFVLEQHSNWLSR